MQPPGKILDGRNRYRACKELNLQPAVKQYSGNDPLGYVLSANFHRRHLNESQRAMVAARIVTTKLGDNQHIKKEGRSIDLSTAAGMLNVSEKSVKRAKGVCQRGVLEIRSMVDRGKIAVSAARRLVDELSKEEQAEVVKSGDAGIRKKAKELGKRDPEARRIINVVKDLKKQVDDFIAEWPNLNEWQKNFFVKTYQGEIAKILEWVKSKAGVVEVAPQAQKPAAAPTTSIERRV